VWKPITVLTCGATRKSLIFPRKCSMKRPPGLPYLFQRLQARQCEKTPDRIIFRSTQESECPEHHLYAQLRLNQFEDGGNITSYKISLTSIPLAASRESRHQVLAVPTQMRFGVPRPRYIFQGEPDVIPNLNINLPHFLELAFHISWQRFKPPKTWKELT